MSLKTIRFPRKIKQRNGQMDGRAEDASKEIAITQKDEQMFEELIRQSVDGWHYSRDGN